MLGIAVPSMWARASAQGDDDVLKVIPENYTLLIDNPFVRVLEARIPAGTEEKPHRHLKGVSVCLSEYTLESRTLLSFTPLARQDLQHQAVMVFGCHEELPYGISVPPFVAAYLSEGAEEKQRSHLDLHQARAGSRPRT